MNERVLLVDDEEVVLNALGAILNYLGYRVDAKTNGYEALIALFGDPSGFDLVITDYFMPGMKGIEFSARVLESRPEMPIILMTGGDPEMEIEAKAIGIREFIQKPIDVADLARTIGRAFGR